MTLFIIASLSWSYFSSSTDTLQMWQAMVILVIHGLRRSAMADAEPDAAIRYRRPVGPGERGEAQRDGALSSPSWLAPAVGGAILLALGPSVGIMLNTVFLPAAGAMARQRALWATLPALLRPAPRRAVRGLGDIVQTVRDIKKLSPSSCR